MAAEHEARGLRARGVAVSRDGREVMRDARLDVRPGEVTALMAPSGRGKSTLLRCCVRLLPVSAGEVRLHGTPVEELDPRDLRRTVGLVAQAPVMLPGTVADNLRHGLGGLDPAAATAALGAAGLGEDFAARDAPRLSGGEAMRVAIARALVRDPEVLLLDEPTAALDGALVVHLAETLVALAHRGLAVCVATHDGGFAGLVADRPVGLDGSEC